MPHRYVEQLERAGGIAVVVPPARRRDRRRRHAVLARLDGLVIAGGADVEVDRYDAEPPPDLAQPPRPDRDVRELALARVSRDDLPVLGICRGMQVMAVAAGGVLDQHLPDRLGHLDHGPGPGTYGLSQVEPVVGSRLRGLLGPRWR